MPVPFGTSSVEVKPLAALRTTAGDTITAPVEEIALTKAFDTFGGIVPGAARAPAATLPSETVTDVVLDDVEDESAPPPQEARSKDTKIGKSFFILPSPKATRSEAEC